MPGDQARDRSTLWAILAVVGGLAVMLALTLYNERRDAAAAAPAPRVEHETASAASYACQEFLRRQLTAPATADFDVRSQSASKSASAWTATGAVDAENSFGAQIRTRYTCRVQYSAPLREWTLLGLSTEP